MALVILEHPEGRNKENGKEEERKKGNKRPV